MNLYGLLTLRLYEYLADVLIRCMHFTLSDMCSPLFLWTKQQTLFYWLVSCLVLYNMRLCLRWWYVLLCVSSFLSPHCVATHKVIWCVFTASLVQTQLLVLVSLVCNSVSKIVHLSKTNRSLRTSSHKMVAHNPCPWEHSYKYYTIHVCEAVPVYVKSMLSQ